MSTELDTIREGVSIASFADGRAYKLTVWESGKGAIRKESFLNANYEVLVRGLWEKYLDQGERPKLAGETLTDQGFVLETLHVIAPGVFFTPDGPPLMRTQETFLHWLKGKMSEIRGTLEQEQADRLNKGLDYLLHTHLERTRQPYHT